MKHIIMGAINTLVDKRAEIAVAAMAVVFSASCLAVNAKTNTQINVNAEKAKSITPDCKSLSIMLMSLPTSMAVTANWQVVDSNGKQIKNMSIGDLNKKSVPDFSISCPNFNATYDGKTLKINADSYQSIIDHLYKQLNRGVDLYNYRWYEDPKLKNEFEVNKYSFDLENFSLTDGYIKLAEGAKLSSKQAFVPELATISYKINGGELKPLLQNKKVMAYHDAFKKAKSIDIYHKNPDLGQKGFGVQRIFIDKENGVLEIYKEYRFPANN